MFNCSKYVICIFFFYFFLYLFSWSNTVTNNQIKRGFFFFFSIFYQVNTCTHNQSLFHQCCYQRLIYSSFRWRKSTLELLADWQPERLIWICLDSLLSCCENLARTDDARILCDSKIESQACFLISAYICIKYHK